MDIEKATDKYVQAAKELTEKLEASGLSWLARAVEDTSSAIKRVVKS